MSNRFYFNVFNAKGEKVGVHDVPNYLAKTEQECWQLAEGLVGNAFSYYPTTYKAVLIDAGESENKSEDMSRYD